MLQLGGLAIPGSRSVLGTFGPSQTPSSFGDDAQSIEYNIKNTISVSFTRSDVRDESNSEWSQVNELLQAPWFGGKTGKGTVEVSLIEMGPESRYVADFIAVPLRL